MRKIFLFILLLSSFSLTAQMQMRLRGSHNPVLTPQQVDSLFYWFDANNLSSLQDSVGGAIANNEGVATWYDMSGRGYHVTQTTDTDRPVYKATGGPGSKPCLQFDGSDDLLISSSAHWWGSDDMTLFVVMKFANATRDAIEIITARETTATTRQFLFYSSNSAGNYKGIVRAYQANTPVVLNFQNETPNNWKHTNWKVHAWTNNGNGTMSFYSDGSSVSMTSVGAGDGTIDNLSQELQIGAQRVPANSFLQGSISEIIVYSKALTADERVGIEEYLQAKWGL